MPLFIKGDPPLGEMLPEPGIMTGADPFCKMPELTKPAVMEFPLQFRDLLS